MFYRKSIQLKSIPRQWPANGANGGIGRARFVKAADFNEIGISLESEAQNHQYDITNEVFLPRGAAFFQLPAFASTRSGGLMLWMKTYPF